MNLQKGFSIVEWMVIFTAAAILCALVVTFITQTSPKNQKTSISAEMTSPEPDTKRTYDDKNLNFQYPSRLIRDKNVQGSRVFKTSDFTKGGEYITKGYSIGYSLADYTDYPTDQLVLIAGEGDCDDYYEKCEKLTSKQGVTFILGNLKDKKSSHIFGQEIQAKAMSDGKMLFVFGINMNKDAQNIEQALQDLREIISSLSFKPEHTFVEYQ